jgi:hypothetical protein
VFAPNHRLRARIVPAQRGLGAADAAGYGKGSAVPKHAALTWAQRLKRVFGIESESCEHCGGAVKIIASIEDPQVIGSILEHLGLEVATPTTSSSRRCALRRSDPASSSIDPRCCAGRLISPSARFSIPFRLTVGVGYGIAMR